LLGCMNAAAAYLTGRTTTGVNAQLCIDPGFF